MASKALAIIAGVGPGTVHLIPRFPLQLTYPPGLGGMITDER